jgi:hypothetical protein
MKQLTPKQMLYGMDVMSKDKEWRKELRKGYREVGKVGAKHARSGMRSMSERQIVVAAKKVRGVSHARGAFVRLNGRVPTSTKPMGVLAGVMGTKGGTGWFAGHPTIRNNPPWIGNSWKVATRGQGPRGFNSGLADGVPEIIETFEVVSVTLIDRAFRVR